MAKTKYIFVSGGVISALGKGVTAASISLLLKKHGFKVHPIKCENYLNVDSGTINPIEHGDPFLCNDGLEADQDLGNYERFLEQEVGRENFMTMGQLYKTVIDKERSMGYNGEDVEPIPHIVNEIISRITGSAEKAKADFCIIELGGTVGEYENNNGLYYEASRIMAFKLPVAHVHVTYIPVPNHVGEPKTKPAQFGLKQLMSMGISPNFIVCRSELPIDDLRKYKFAQKFNISKDDIISAENLDDIHEVPLHLHRQNLDTRILKHFGVRKSKQPDIKDWQSFISKVKKLKGNLNKKANIVNIAIVGKYFGTGNFQLNDSYLALMNALKHAAISNTAKLNIIAINSEKEEGTLENKLKKADGIVIPIGWGSRGIEGKIKAIKYARENKIPYLGLCYGMQLACVEYARNALKMKGAHSKEVNPKTTYPIIHDIPFDEKYQTIKGAGTSMRLGHFDCIVKKDTLAYRIYKNTNRPKIENVRINKDGTLTTSERHRHRYEFNNEFRKVFEDSGFIFSGVSPDDFFVEIIELPKDKHPFFIATQAHPEYKSYPLHPHPMFVEFIKEAGKS